MTTTSVYEPAPRRPPQRPPEQIALPSPGAEPQPPQDLLSLLIFPLITFGAALVMMVFMLQSGNGVQTLFILPMLAAGLVGAPLVWGLQRRRHRRAVLRRKQRYNDALRQTRQALEAAQALTLAELTRVHPPPDTCRAIARRPADQPLWIRRPTDDDFLDLRLGLGAVPLPVAINTPALDPMTPDLLVVGARRQAEEFATVDKAPIVLPLAAAGAVGVAGPRPAVVNLARGLIVQLATHHAPSDVWLALVYPAAERDQWEWARWLPHVADGERRFLACDAEGVSETLNPLREELNARRLALGGIVAGESTPRHIVLIIAAPELLPADDELLADADKARLHYSVIWLRERVGQLRGDLAAIVNLEGARPLLEWNLGGAPPPRAPFDADTTPLPLADATARALAPLQVRRREAGVLPSIVSLLGTLGLESPAEVDWPARWARSDPRRSLAVPIGVRPGGRLQLLDLQSRGEATLDSGHGPHGIIAGATNQGKSEIIHTLIAATAATFDPRDVNFVLFDFKPPAVIPLTFELPHVVNHIDYSDKDRVPRALAALEAELLARRSALFKRAGGVVNLEEYLELHRQGDPRAAERLPYIIIIVDEFGKCRQEFPDLMKRFETLAMQGRAYGARMILATQKPGGVIGEEVQANVGLRICLKVEREIDSKDMLGNDLAYHLKSPGRAYLKQGASIMQVFQSSFPRLRQTRATVVEDPLWHVARVWPNGRRDYPFPRPKDDHEGLGTELQALIMAIAGHAETDAQPRGRPIWLPPLPEELARADVWPADGWNGDDWTPVDRWLAPIIGRQDDPLGQRQPPLQPDLGRGDHLAIIGESDDTRHALRTLIAALAHDHSPDDLHITILDFGGFGLSLFRELPHVGNVITRDDTRRLRRLGEWLEREKEARQIALQGYDSLAQARAGGHERLPGIVLIIQDPGPLRDEPELDALRQTIDGLAREGAAIGIHLVLAGPATMLTRLPGLLSQINNLRLALGLRERALYRDVVGRFPDDALPPVYNRGRGLFLANGNVLECQVAGPVADDPYDNALSDLVKAMRAAARRLGLTGPPVIHGALPDRIALDDLIALDVAAFRARRPAGLAVPIGRDDATLQPALLDVRRDGQRYLIRAPQGGGKTTALHTWLLALAAALPPDEVRFFLFDTAKAGLAPLRDLPQVARYALVGTPDADAALAGLDATLRARRAGEAPAAPPLIAVIDDYELLVGLDKFKDTLQAHIPASHPYGFFLILATSTGATDYDPLRRAVEGARAGLLVGSQNLLDDSAAFAARLSAEQYKLQLPPGRALLFRNGAYELIQVALPGDVAAWVRRIAALDIAPPLADQSRQMPTPA